MSLLRYVRRPPNFRSLAGKFAVRHVSTNPSNGMQDLVNMLEEEGKKHPVRTGIAQNPLVNAPFGSTSRPTQQRGPIWKAFRPHDFVSPHHLTLKSRATKAKVYIKRPAVGPPPAYARYNDPFHQLGLDPLMEAHLNPTLLSGFVSEMGKIYGRNVTKLTIKNQRRIGKAVRRAKMMGIIPVLSRSFGGDWGRL